MASAVYNFINQGNKRTALEKGATFDRTFKYQNQDDESAVDLTGYTARMKVKNSAGTEILSLTTENTRIVLGGTAGTIQLLVSATDTAALTAGKYVYDLELITGSTVKRLLEGTLVVTAEVTV